MLPRKQALAIPNIISTASDLLPPDIEMVRIVDINGIDIQADGGTHVASTAMIGRIAVTKMESKDRGFRRLRIRIEDAESTTRLRAFGHSLGPTGLNPYRQCVLSAPHSRP